jgi:hypothetical protein
LTKIFSFKPLEYLERSVMLFTLHTFLFYIF